MIDRRDAITDLRTAYGQHIAEEPTFDVPEAELRLGVELIAEEFIELSDAVAERDIIETADAIADLQVVLEQFALLLGINTDRVFAEVHRSNLTKIGPGGKVQRNDAGKVIKPEGYERPDIAAALAPADGQADLLASAPDLVVAPSVAHAQRTLSIKAPQLAHLPVITPASALDLRHTIARHIYVMEGVTFDPDWNEIRALCEAAVSEHPRGEIKYLGV